MKTTVCFTWTRLYFQWLPYEDAFINYTSQSPPPPRRRFPKSSVISIQWQIPAVLTAAVRRWLDNPGSWIGWSDFEEKNRTNVRIFKTKSLPHARPNLPIFWNWTHKNQQQCVHFRKSQICLYHSTLLMEPQKWAGGMTGEAVRRQLAAHHRYHTKNPQGVLK